MTSRRPTPDVCIPWMPHNVDVQVMRLRQCLGATAGDAVVREHGLQGGIFRHRIGTTGWAPARSGTLAAVTLTASNKPSVSTTT